MLNKKSNKAEESLLRAGEELVKYAKGELKLKTYYISVPQIDVHQVRRELCLSQNQFAKTFGVSVSTLRNWEKGRRSPTGAAKILLKIIQKDSKIVKQILKA